MTKTESTDNQIGNNEMDTQNNQQLFDLKPAKGATKTPAPADQSTSATDPTAATDITSTTKARRTPAATKTSQVTAAQPTNPPEPMPKTDQTTKPSKDGDSTNITAKTRTPIATTTNRANANQSDATANAVASPNSRPNNIQTQHPKPPFRPSRAALEAESDKSTQQLINTIGESNDAQLQQIAIAQGIPADQASTKRANLIMTLLRRIAEQSTSTRPRGAGVLDVTPEGFGFLRPLENDPDAQDIHVTRSTINTYRLRPSDVVVGQLQPPRGGGKLYALQKAELINGYSPERLSHRQRFEKLEPQYPDQLIKLETNRTPLATRIIDLVAPIGYGQRALIVAPPKAGKTIILKQIATSIHTNQPEIDIIVVLIGERPEEITDMRRTIHGELYGSSFDESVEHQCRVANRALERARRIVEMGGNVVILLDSLTRLARAYNILTPSSGKTLSGGMDPNALYPPKKFFGTARNCAEGGSLTIIATTLVDTGSRLDDLIYEEFKGTGNMELHLDRSMADRRIFPAIDIIRSGTRHEEKLLDPQTLQMIWKLRRWATYVGKESNSNDTTEASERIIQQIKNSPSNPEFLHNLSNPKT